MLFVPFLSEQQLQELELEEDLILVRDDTIRLLQPDKLMQKLSENYVPPKTKERVRLKVSEGIETIVKLLGKESQELGLSLVAVGAASVGIHAHPVDEALTLEEGLLACTAEGKAQLR